MIRILTYIILGLLVFQPEGSSQDTLMLFNGVSMDGWDETYFEGQGKVSLKDSSIILGTGSDLTGISWIGDYPISNYEITLEAMRIEGNDFFCALTFPVKSSFCTLVLGGWGGSVIGLSSIDGYDAFNNFTGDSRNFSNNRWYSVRLRVTDEKIEAWLGRMDKMVDFTIQDYRLSVRWEVEPSIPLGIATYKTTGAIRNIQLILLTGE